MRTIVSQVPPGHVSLVDDDDAEKLADVVRGLMHHWDSNDRAADYTCEFCMRRPPTNNHHITHHRSCAGLRLLQLLGCWTNGGEFSVDT